MWARFYESSNRSLDPIHDFRDSFSLELLFLESVSVEDLIRFGPTLHLAS